MDKKNYAVYNPKKLKIKDLPIIYGFNNGGCIGMLSAQLIAEDGTCLGGHCCSSEGFMYGDLGIIKGYRKDRHEDFKKHYPKGYRMDFVSHGDVKAHDGLSNAIKLNEKLGEKAKQAK